MGIRIKRMYFNCAIRLGTSCNSGGLIWRSLRVMRHEKIRCLNNFCGTPMVFDKLNKLRMKMIAKFLDLAIACAGPLIDDLLDFSIKNVHYNLNA